MVQSIVDQLAKYIEHYPPKDQPLLNQFLYILAQHEKVRFDRQTLVKYLTDYRTQVMSGSEYLTLPFHWFVGTYIRNALLHLELSKFHADNFYRYVAKHLKNCFQLIKAGIPLSDEKAWEKIQYQSAIVRVPLSASELQLFSTLQSVTMNSGYNALDPVKLLSTVKDTISLPDSSLNFPNYLKIYDSKWDLLFHPPAFGLEYVFVHIQLNEGAALSEVIDFQNPHNTVLCNSFFYNIRGLSKCYVGLLSIPTQDLTKLEYYLQKCEKQDQIVLYEFSRVKMFQRSFSLALYKAGQGWIKLSSTKWKKLVETLRTPNPRKIRAKFELFSLTSPFNTSWSYKNHPVASRIIRLYCDIRWEFSFEKSSSKKLTMKDHSLKTDEIGLLKYLFKKHVVQCGFRSDQLWNEWALDFYWIKIPPLTTDQLHRLLQWLPFTELFHSEECIYMRVRLPLELAQRIKEDLKWTVFSTILHHYPLSLQYPFFDLKTLQWRIPAILKE